MPIIFPDYLKSNNPNEPIVRLEDKQVKGASIVVNVSARNNIGANLRVEGYQTYVQSTDKTYVYTNTDLGQTAWDLIANWKVVGDNTYTEAFVGANTWVVVHNMNKYPSVMVVDTDGDHIEGFTIVYDSINQITLSFKAAGALTAVSGTVYTN